MISYSALQVRGAIKMHEWRTYGKDIYGNDNLSGEA